MANSACMKELAGRIWENSEHEINGMGHCLEIEGVPVTFPYQDVEQVPFNEPISSGICDSYLAMKDLHCPETMPKNWIAFIQQAAAIREKKGCNSPVNLVHAVNFVLEDFSEAVQQENLSPFDVLPEGCPDLRDAKKVREVIDAVLDSPRLNSLLVHTLRSLIPDMSGGAYLERDEAIEVIRGEGLQSGRLLDIGCGLGKNTGQWGEKTGLQTIGVDRQYHPKWYRENWRNNQSGVQFARADIAEAIPMPEKSVNVVVYENVVPHQTVESVAQTLVNINHVLCDKGLLIVGPQTDEQSWERGGWMFLRKQGDGLEQEIV